MSGEVWRCVAPHADAEGLRLWSTRSRQAVTKNVPRSRLRCSKRIRISIDAAFEQRNLRNQVRDIQSQLGGRKDRLESARMSEWSSPFLSRTLLRTLSALLTICLLAQFFVAGVAAMTDPGWWTYHSDWVAIFQWLVIPLPILAWLGGPPRGRRTLLRMHSPYLRSRCNMCWRTAQSKAAVAIGLGLHALDLFFLLPDARDYLAWCDRIAAGVRR